LIPVLQAEGHDVIAAQHGLDALASDVAAVRNTLGRVRSPVILVGHSYGGTLIPEPTPALPGSSTSLRWHRMPTKRRKVCRPKFPVTEVFSHIEVADGRIWLKPDGVPCFAGDLSEQEQKLVWATQGVPVPDLFTQQVEGTAWRSKPNWFVVAKNDRTVHPELQRFVAKRMEATVVEVDSSHVPMLSQPAVVLDVIRKAANAVQKA
jgi:pimeloyl-ACP methyl ester carboxylesterase